MTREGLRAALTDARRAWRDGGMYAATGGDWAAWSRLMRGSGTTSDLEAIQRTNARWAEKEAS